MVRLNSVIMLAFYRIGRDSLVRLHRGQIAVRIFRGFGCLGDFFLFILVYVPVSSCCLVVTALCPEKIQQEEIIERPKSFPAGIPSGMMTKRAVGSKETQNLVFFSHHLSNHLSEEIFLKLHKAGIYSTRTL